MTTALKPISQQKLLEVLENCKQIPKDDRLVLRKLLKDGDEQLTTILTDFNHKKLQIRVRKYFQKCKQNKQGQEINRQKTVVDVRGLAKQPAPSYYRSAMQSMQKQRQMRRTHHSKDYKHQLEQCKSLNSSKCDPVRSMKVNTCIQGSFAPIQFKIDTRNSATKYTYEDNYLKQSQSNIFSPPQFLKWDSLKLATSIPTSNITSGRNSVSLYPANPISNSKISEQSEFSSIFSRLRASLPGIPGLPLTGQKDPEKDVYNLKSILIKHYAEDIFDHLVQLHFPLSINEKSVYLPYRQLLQELQTYLRNKGQTIDIIKENDQKIMLLQPFLNEYQGVSLKNLGIFLNKFCLHKNNNIRNIFIVLESGDKGNISVDKFRKINSWKGQDLVSAFQVVVKKWGQCNAIGYWQLYRVKKEKEFIYFINLYQKV